MKSVGLITEYNPMHNGHLFHLNKAKELTKADCVIAVMSGDFVQRGAPAMLDKHSRAAAAVEAGINLIVELPICSALSSAEGFALGAVEILNALSVDSIVFGSECGDMKKLEITADILINETPEYKQALTSALTSGCSYPAARQAAVKAVFDTTSASADFADILSMPNNILGIEYIKAIKKLNSSITLQTIKRDGTGYHQTTLNGLPSASAIRSAIFSADTLDALKNTVPDAMSNILNHAVSNNFIPIQTDDFTLLFNAKMNEIIYKCRCDKNEIINKLCSYPDMNEDLAARMFKSFHGCEPLSSYCLRVKSKQYTYSRISRAVFHIILDLHCANTEKMPASYIRILGFDQIGAKYLSSIKKNCSLPLITKTSNHTALLIDDIRCSHIYNEIVYSKCGYLIPDEYRCGVYRKDTTIN